MKKICILCAAIALLTGCTDNSRVKNFGGTAAIDLPPNTKLLNVTWKEEELWLLTRERRADEPIETYKFQEKSSWGLIQGTYIIKEK